MAKLDPEDDDVEEPTRIANIKEIRTELEAGGQRDRAYLIVLTGSNVGEMHRIDAGETFLGRGQNVAIRFDDDGISRRHARIVQSGGEVFIEDLQSANGTHVNGVPVQKQGLQDGDKIRIGSTTVLKFTYHDHLDESFQQQMYDAALRDGLTKAYNKKYFLDRLDTEVAYAIRHSAALSLLMFDVDHFKNINDTFGHLAGDYVLARLAKVASAGLRQEDVFARYGGEEFSILCRGVPLGNTGVLAERLRGLVEASVFEHDGKRMQVTISAGVASYPEIPVKSGTQLIASADEALYEAKRGGRNRVILKYASK